MIMFWFVCLVLALILMRTRRSKRATLEQRVREAEKAIDIAVRNAEKRIFNQPLTGGV